MPKEEGVARSECVVAVAVRQLPVAGGAVLGRPASEVAAHLAVGVAVDPTFCSFLTAAGVVLSGRLAAVCDKLAQQQLPRVLSPA